MITITLPPDLEAALAREATLRGTTPELLALDLLQRSIPADVSEPSLANGTSLADALRDYIGAESSEERYPEGSSLSENTGRRFAQAMSEKHARGNL